MLLVMTAIIICSHLNSTNLERKKKKKRTKPQIEKWIFTDGVVDVLPEACHNKTVCIVVPLEKGDMSTTEKAKVFQARYIPWVNEPEDPNHNTNQCIEQCKTMNIGSRHCTLATYGIGRISNH